MLPKLEHVQVLAKVSKLQQEMISRKNTTHILVGHSRGALSEGKRGQGLCFLACTEYGKCEFTRVYPQFRCDTCTVRKTTT